MASTAVTLFQGAKLPAHIKGFDEANITNRGGVNQLSIMGKVWRTIIGGKDTALTKTDSDGDSVPVSIVRFIVLQHNQARSRSYFESDFDPKKPMPPTCWSNDGVTPADEVPEAQKQSRKCAKCKQSIKGSKITENGKESVACAQFKRVAIIADAATKPDASDEIREAFPPMLLKLPQTSLWDKNADAQAEKGWYAWDQYLDFLRQNNVKHTGLVVTKAKFDPEHAFPKVLFKADSFVEADQLAIIRPMFTDEEIAKLLDAPENIPTTAAAKESAEDTDAADDDDDVAPVRPSRAKKGGDEDADDAPAPKAKKKVVVAVDDDDDDAPAPKKVKHEVIDDDADDAPAADDDDDDGLPPPKPKAKKVVVADDDDDADAVTRPRTAKEKAADAAAVKARVPERKKAVSINDDEDEPAPKAKAKVTKGVDPDDEDDVPVPKKKAKAVVADDDDDAPAPVAKKKKVVVDDDDAPAAPAKKAKGDDISNLLKEWPDDE